MNGTFVIIGILSIYVFAALLIDRISGPVPPPYPWFTKKHQGILYLQTIALSLSVLIFTLLYLIQPNTRAIWLVGTIGIYYASISAMVRRIAAGRFSGRTTKGWYRPSIGIHAMVVGVFWLGIALFISYLVLFDPEWVLVPLQRPIPVP
jgi:dolichol kinase